MLNNFSDVIVRLEAQKAAIDKAIAILRDFDEGNGTETAPKKTVAKKAKKRVMSEAGKKAIRDAARKRWAGIKKAAKEKAAKEAA